MEANQELHDEGGLGPRHTVADRNPMVQNHGSLSLSSSISVVSAQLLGYDAVDLSNMISLISE
jgi:hypothetical protein